MKRTLWLTCAILIQSFVTEAHSAYLQWNADCQKAFNQVFALQLSHARETVKQTLISEPTNYMPILILDYADCMELLLNGNPNTFKKVRANKDIRLRLIDETSRTSPHYRFVKASIYFHWAAIYFRFGEQLNAANHFRKAHQLLRENHRLYPRFAANKVLLGFTTAVAGTIPDNYQWIAQIMGMKGNIHQGIAMIDSYILQHPNEELAAEALIYQLYLKYYLQKKEEWVWQRLNTQQYGVNALQQMVKANLAINYRKGQAALKILNMVPEHMKNTFPVFWYELGQALQMKLDGTAALAYKNFLKQYHGGWYVKDAWYHLALVHYYEGNLSAARQALNNLQTQGSTVLDADKQAQRFAEQQQWPQPQLYKAAMLAHGGYLDKALQALQTAISLRTNAEKTEYYFRLGRIHEEMNKDEEAVRYYNLSYSIGKKETSHYAARSALYIGIIHEKNGRKAEAIKWFQLCLSLRDHDYQTSIKNQAKAGLNRISG